MRSSYVRGAGPAAVLLLAACATAAAAELPPLPPERPSAALTLPALPAPPDVPAPAETLGTAFPVGRSLYLPLLRSEAQARGLPPEVADAVAQVESGYNSAATGRDGERGMMQVMPPTASLLGFKGTLEELAAPETNIRLGVTYLAGAWRAAGGDLCRALMKYRAGHNEERMSALSVEYCRRAKLHLAAIGSPLAAGTLPAVAFGAARPSSGLGAMLPATTSAGLVRRGRRFVVANRRSFWAAHTARIKAIEARLPWKRGGIMIGG